MGAARQQHVSDALTITMSEFTESENGPPSLCPECGEPLMQVRTSDFDEVGPRRVDFECPNRHQVVVHRLEVDDGGVLDDDAAGQEPEQMI